MPSSIADFAITAVLGYGVVFFGLVLLMLVVMLVGRIMARRADRAAAPAPVAKAAPAACPAQPAPGSAGQVKRFDVPDREAAMLMAIVADKMGRPLNELRFISIKEVK
jgi:Na+-transporting methylmalonyl-CoA/oxaloacetate decarboxylase gamma subunit